MGKGAHRRALLRWDEYYEAEPQGLLSGEGDVEQVGRNTDDQAIQEFSDTWESFQESHYASESGQHVTPLSRAAMERQVALRFPESSPASSSSPPEAFAYERAGEQVLARLGAVAHELASADGTTLLPLALQELLALCHSRRGLILTHPVEADAPLVALREQFPEDLGVLFAQEPRFWRAAAGDLEVVSSGKRSKGAPESKRTRGTLEARLAAAGVSWYVWLPLAIQGRVEVVLVALGVGAPAHSEERALLHLAAALLGDLTVAALEHAQLRHQLLRKERDREEFLGLASHELKSPLTVIKGYAQLLLRQARREGNAGKVDLDGLEAINQQVSRMSHLLGDLLDFSRMDRGILEVEPQPTELVALVRRLLEQRQRSLPEMIFRLIAREPLLVALADPTRLEQALCYLLDNASKFGRDQQVVEVTVQRGAIDSLPVASTLGARGLAEAAMPVAPDEVALISVRDYGPGVPAAERALLFTAFYRGPENSIQRQLAGLGLGLYLSHYLVTRQHGHLWAEFPAGEHFPGSIFHVGLPLPSGL